MKTRSEKLAELRRLLSGQHETDCITVERGYDPGRSPDPYWLRIMQNGKQLAAFYFETEGDRDSIVKLYSNEQ